MSCFSLGSTEFISTPRPVPGPPFLVSAIRPLPGYQVSPLFSVLLSGRTWSKDISYRETHALCRVLTSERYCVADGGIGSRTFLSLQLPWTAGTEGRKQAQKVGVSLLGFTTSKAGHLEGYNDNNTLWFGGYFRSVFPQRLPALAGHQEPVADTCVHSFLNVLCSEDRMQCEPPSSKGHFYSQQARRTQGRGPEITASER